MVLVKAFPILRDSAVRGRYYQQDASGRRSGAARGSDTERNRVGTGHGTVGRVTAQGSKGSDGDSLGIIF